MIYTCKPKKIEFYHNIYGKAPEQIQRETGCTTILNGVLFNGNGSLCCDNRIDGKTISNDQYAYWGYAWNKDKSPVITHSNLMERYDNYLSCLCAVKDGKPEPVNDKDQGAGGRRGRMVIGFRADREMVILATSDSSGAMQLSEARAKMLELGCQDALILDGGGSVYLSCPAGKVETSADRKKWNRTYILLYEDIPEKKFKVCIDPGHGLKEPNQSPDGRYLEYKMAWKLANKTKELLESTERFDVLLTKSSEGETPSLAQRAKIANDWGADLFWAKHSNAIGETSGTDAQGYNDKIHGLTVWIYALGGQRERLARLLLEQCKELGIELFGSELYTAKFAVLAQTYMPAILVENYFHTCRTDVEKLLQDEEIETLAYAAARGICEYFNLGEDLIPLEPEEIEEEYGVWVDILYRVQLGAFQNESNAEAMAKALKSHGFDTIIKEERQ